MVQQVVNIGSSANDGTGDPLRTAFTKINENFSEVYGKDAAGANFNLTDNTIYATNTNGNVELEPNGTGYVVINTDNVVLSTTKTPASAIGAAGDIAGMVAYDSSYIYVCTANYDGASSIWKRSAIASW